MLVVCGDGESDGGNDENSPNLQEKVEEEEDEENQPIRENMLKKKKMMMMMREIQGGPERRVGSARLYTSRRMLFLSRRTLSFCRYLSSPSSIFLIF